MAVAPVQKANSSSWFSSSSTAAATFVTQNTAAGNLYWLAVYWSDTTKTISSIADTEGNTWTAIGSPIADAGNNFAMQLAYAKNVAGGSKPTVTVTFSGALSNRDLAIHEASGCDTAAPLDGSTNGANITGSGVDAITTAAYTTTANGDLLVAGMGSPSQHGNTVTAGTGYTLQVSDNTHSEMFGTETQVQAASSASTVGKFSVSGFTQAIVTGASFKASTGGGGARALFRTPPVNGIGVGGSFFRDPLAAPHAFVRRDRIFVPAWMGEAA